MCCPAAARRCCCSIGPKQYRTTTPLAPKSAYECALSIVDSLNYTLRSSDRTGGFFTAEKSYLLGSRYDVLTVSTLKRGGGTTELHVTAETDGVDQNGRGATILSGGVQADANLVMGRCGARSESTGHP